MNKNLFGVLVVFVFVVELLSCKTKNQLNQPRELKTDKHQIQYQRPTTKTNPKQTIPIHLAVGSFDPLSEDTPIIVSHDLMLQNYEKNEIGNSEGDVLK